jgi:hypothetical protein
MAVGAVGASIDRNFTGVRALPSAADGRLLPEV